ncbi:MAG: hypothetical protein KGL10_07530 [Alphaproteobacteria bacterium]|nr:hypothetical protein [Alphaproteobacteria bacterium]MDE2337146.1 hypothetical protein [Alphaproteobacteria bacterium]
MRAPRSFWRDRILICLAVLLSYASVWPNEFVFDDNVLIQANTFLKTPQGLFKIFTHLNGAGAGWHAGFYRPVPMAAHFFIYWFSYPLTVAFHMPLTLGFHALNVALQALNGCLLLAFGVRAGFGKNAALAAALLWAVHPLHVEAVAYMNSTPELMCGTFCLLGLITLLPKEAPADGVVDPQKAFTPRKIKLSLVPFALALLSKESAVVFPALAAATLFLISPERLRLSAYFRTWPLWLLSFAYTLIIVFVILGHGMDGPLNLADVSLYKSSVAVRVWTALGTLPSYARLIVWPKDLYFRREGKVFADPAHGRVLLGGALVLLAALQILWGRAKRGLALSFGLLWFAAAQSPNTGIATPIDAIISEHWMYLPTMGLFLGVAQSFAGLFRDKKQAAALLVAALTTALGVATFRQNMVWRDMDTLYRNTARHGGGLTEMHGNEALFLMSRQQFGAARRQAQRALAGLPQNHGQASALMHMLMAMAWLHVAPVGGWAFTPDALRRALPEARHVDEAVAELEESVRINPDDADTHAFLSIVYAFRGDKKQAAAQDKIANQLRKKDE